MTRAGYLMLACLLLSCGHADRAPVAVELPAPSAEPPQVTSAPRAVRSAAPRADMIFPPNPPPEPGLLQVFVAADGRIGVHGSVVDLDGLAAAARAYEEQNPGAGAKLVVDRKAVYRSIIEVMDRLQGAGLEEVQLSPTP